MIIIIICGILGGLFAITDYGDFGDFILGCFFGAFIGIIICLFTGLAYDNSEYRTGRAVPLVSMADGAGIEGHFFLGSGSIDSYPSFTWYEKSGDNSYVRKDVDADSATVHYLANGQTPYYTKDTSYYTESCGLKPWGIVMDCHSTGDSRYEFYIPRGSIVQSYKLDNK